MTQGTLVTVTTETEIVVKKVAVNLNKAAATKLIKQLNDARSGKAALEASENEAKAALRALLGDALVGLIDGVERVVVSPRSRTDVDTKKLKEAFPEAYQASKKVTTYEVLTAK